VFSGRNWLITLAKDRNDAVDAALKEFIENPKLCERGSIYAVYLLAEDLVETYFPLVENLDNQADDLESEMLDKADKESLRKVFDLKHRGFEIRKILGPQRDIMNELARRDFAFMEGENRVYFQDVYGRMIRIFDMLDTIREVLSGNLDIYLSTVSNRLNEVMKVLTVFTVIIGVMAVITGFFGMNFEYLPGLKSPVSVIAITVGMVVLTFVMLYIFKRKNWL
jgi:magnesium transporter